MLGPVHWGSFPGEYLEQVMAVLVAQEHPDTLRRVPASGDGGIDLMVPSGAGCEVRQVKRFTGRIEAGERRQITKSWETLRTDPRLNRPITGYCLVMPVDPTPDEQAWFEELVADAPWPTAWLGEVHWHDLASRHPHVIDYFIGGGRDRITKRAMALQASIVDPSRPLSVDDVVGPLSMMHKQMNRDDPHYRYDLRTSRDLPDRGEFEGSAFAETRRLPDGGYLTIVVTPKHRYSLRDAPIVGSLTVTIPDPDVAARFQEDLIAFEHFGRALDLPEGTVSVSIKAPGGLGRTFEGGGGWIGPVLSERNQPVRFATTLSDGTVLNELTLTVEAVSTGIAGGTEAHLTDGQILRGTLTIAPPGQDEKRNVNFSFSVDEITDRPVLDVLPTLRFLSALHPPNDVRIRAQYGNTLLAVAHIEGELSVVTEDGLRHLEDLARLQEIAPGAVVCPEEIDAPFANKLREYVRMLDGETITGTWDSITFHLQPGVTRANLPEVLSGVGVLALDEEMRIELNGQTFDLGVFTTILGSAHIAAVQPPDLTSLTLEPDDDATFTRRAGPIIR